MQVRLAYRAFALAADEGRPICQNELDMNPRTARLFVYAVTHPFKEDSHGVTLKTIFKEVPGVKNVYKRNTTPGNPKDESLYDLIIKAMTASGKILSGGEIKINPLAKYSNAELLAELARRMK